MTHLWSSAVRLTTTSLDMILTQPSELNRSHRLGPPPLKLLHERHLSHWNDKRQVIKTTYIHRVTATRSNKRTRVHRLTQLPNASLHNKAASRKRTFVQMKERVRAPSRSCTSVHPRATGDNGPLTAICSELIHVMSCGEANKYSVQGERKKPL